MFRRDRISPCLRSSPRPAYAQGFGGLGLSPPKLQQRRKAGTQDRELQRLSPWIPACAGMSGTCSRTARRRGRSAHIAPRIEFLVGQALDGRLVAFVVLLLWRSIVFLLTIFVA